MVNATEYQQRLQQEEQRLLQSIHGANVDARGLSAEPGGDWGDESVRDEEKDKQFAGANMELATLHQVQDALKRIEEGTFGKCLVDGGPIEEKRLRAVPWTPYCLKHERLQEKGKPRPKPTL